MLCLVTTNAAFVMPLCSNTMVPSLIDAAGLDFGWQPVNTNNAIRNAAGTELFGSFHSEPGCLTCKQQRDAAVALQRMLAIVVMINSMLGNHYSAVSKLKPNNLTHWYNLGMGILAADKTHLKAGRIQNSIHILAVTTTKLRIHFVGAVKAGGAN